MKRRKFIKNSALGLGAATAGLSNSNASNPREKKQSAAPFKMKFAPHIGMFKHSAGEDVIDQIKFMADQGFTAFEDNNLKKREKSLQNKMGETLAKLNMEMGVFVGGRVKGSGPTLTSPDSQYREQYLADIKDSVDAAKRVNAKWMTVIPGRLNPKMDMGYQTAIVTETFKQASAILEPHGLVQVMEPLNFFNHPGLFLTKIAQAYQICKAVDSPACKILFDIYHQQIQEGNIIPNIHLAWEEVGYFQIGDNPGRKEPTTGEINYSNIFKVIQEKGYTGILGMEHGNFHKGKEGEEKLIKAYREVDVMG